MTLLQGTGGSSERARLVDSVVATSDVAGNATFTYGPVQLGYARTFAVRILNAPVGSFFTATASLIQWSFWNGPKVSDPIQLLENESVVVTATGLTPQTQYSMSIVGVSDLEQYTSPLAPDGRSAPALLDTYQMVNGSFTLTGQRSFPAAQMSYYVGAWDDIQFFLQGVTPGVGWRLVFHFFADAAGVFPTGTVTYDVRSFGVAIVDSIPRLGSYLRIDVSASSYTSVAIFRIMARNGPTGSPGGNNGNGLIIAVSPTAIAAGGNLILLPQSVTAGNAMWTIRSTTATWSAILSSVDRDGNGTFLAAIDGDGTFGAGIASVIIPPQECQVELFNTGSGPNLMGTALVTSVRS